MSLHTLVRSSQADKDNAQAILEMFEPKIKKSLRITPPQEREDLYQELSAKLIEIVYNADPDDVLGFWDFQQRTKKEANGEERPS